MNQEIQKKYKDAEYRVAIIKVNYRSPAHLYGDIFKALPLDAKVVEVLSLSYCLAISFFIISEKFPIVKREQEAPIIRPKFKTQEDKFGELETVFDCLDWPSEVEFAGLKKKEA